MVLGFAVVAVFMVAVFSTIVATVNEMKKPPAPDYSPNPVDMAEELPLPLPYRFSYQTPQPNVSYTQYSPYDERFELNESPFAPTEDQPDYGQSLQESQNPPSFDTDGSGSGSVSQDYEYEDEEIRQQKPTINYPQYPQQIKMHAMQQLQQRNPFSPPPFPSSGYGTAGIGYSSAGNGGTPSNKAFIPFFGYVDPVVLIAIVAFPVLCTLGVTSLLMPIIPIVIYIIGLIFPSSRRRTRFPSLRTNSRMRHVSDLDPDFSIRLSSESIENLFRLLSQALDKF